MPKKVLSIEAGVWWTKVAVVDYEKKQPRVYSAFMFQSPSHAVEDGYIRDKDAFVDALKNELTKRNIREREVVFTLTSSKVVTREVTIPYVKDKKIEGIIQSQMREYFPMDVSNYSVTHRKIDVIDADGKKQIKMLLVAIPDNLLNNYVKFAESAGLHIESFDYIGNGTVQLLHSSLSDNAVVVQLEEQATVISVIDHKKVVFQRITPYGYSASLTSIIDHSVWGITDEHVAFEYLLTHNVLHGTPKVRELATEEQTRIMQEQVNEAYEDLTEAIGYHVRVAHTAIEYYQNQIKGEFAGNLYVVGDGARFQGVRELFAREIPLPAQTIKYQDLLNLKESVKINQEQMDAKVQMMVGFLAAIGAATHPLGVMPKTLKEDAGKKTDLKTANWIFAACVVLSAGLIAWSSVRQILAVSEYNRLTTRINELSYIRQVYAENTSAQQEESAIETIDLASHSKNEQLLDLIHELEQALPSQVAIESLQTTDDTVTLNMSSKTKIGVGQMLLNLAEVKQITNVTIPSISEQEDETGMTKWTYSMTASYTDPAIVEAMQAEAEENETNDVTVDDIEEIDEEETEANE